METIPDALVIYDDLGKVTFVNRAFEELYGWSMEELTGKPLINFVPPSEEAVTTQSWERTLRGDKVLFETQRLNKKGQALDLQLSTAIMRNVDGKHTASIVIHRDITDRKRAQEALRASESFLDSVIEQSPYPMWISDHHGTLIRANKALRDLFQILDEDIVEKYNILNDNIVEEQGFMPLIESVFERGDTARFELKYDTSRLKNVALRHSTFVILEVTVFPITDSDNKITNAVIQHMDITERKLAEEALSESEERMRLLIESAPIAIRIATQGRYSYVNPAFLDMFGYDCSDEIEGLPVEALYVEEDKRLITERNINRAMGLDVDPHYRVTGIRKDGTHIELDAWGSEISYQGQRSTLRFLIDVTEANSLRAQLLQAQKMEAVGTLAGGIAHDFNNLLQAILGYSEFMLQHKKEGESDYNNLHKIYDAGQRGADLVKSLMTFSQKVETRHVPVNLNQEITQLQDLLSRTIPKTIKVDLHLSDDLESINAGRSQIGQVLMNLAVNARDAMPDGGTLIFETANVRLDKEYCSSHLEAMPGNYVLLTFSDTGQGMNRKTLSHIFEPFYTTKETGKGTGLGLATVYGIVKQHSGYITCYSEPGHGTTFKIYLPAIHTSKELETPISETTILGGTETVLLVDDDDDIRDLVATLLIESGYKVITAGNGKEALEAYQMARESLSLIILDLIMPEMDGRQCLAKILRIDPKAKIIIASGYSENGPASSAIASGAKGFVQKPYKMRQLLTMIREVLDKD
jgi:PAS domain S-box-containing protein